MLNAVVEVDESDNKDKDKKIKELQEEVEVLRKKIEQDDEYDNMSSHEWSKTLSQEEIDDIVMAKICQNMLEIYAYVDVTELQLLEDVIDFVKKDEDCDYFDDDFKHVLSLGLRTTQNLHRAIYVFLKMASDTHGDDTLLSTM